MMWYSKIFKIFFFFIIMIIIIKGEKRITRRIGIEKNALI